MTLVDAENPTTMANVGRTRVGGLLLALGAILLIAGFTTYFAGVEVPESGDTTAQRAEKIVDGRDALLAASWTGVFADVLIVLGAFFLVTRTLPTRGHYPASAFWIFVALGALAFLTVDLIAASSYANIAENYATNRVLFESVESTTNLAFSLGVVVFSLGLGGVFVGEARSATAAVPNWVSYVALAGCAGGLVGGVGLMLGATALGYFLAGLYLVFVPMAYLGVRLAWPTLGTSATTTDATDAQDGPAA